MDKYTDKELLSEESEAVYNAACSSAQKALEQEHFEQAIDSFNEALKIKPKQIQVMGELCFCYSQVNQLDDMLNLAQKALLIAQKHISKDNIGRFYFYIGQYYKVTEQFEEAIKYFTLAKPNKPHFVSIYIDSAYCFKMLGKYIEAMNMYEQVKKIDPDFAEKNEIQKLIEDAKEKSSLQRPESPHIRQGVAYEEQGEFKLANAEFYKAVELASKTDFLPLLLLFKNEVKLNEDHNKIIVIGEKLFSLLKNNKDTNESSILLESVCLGLHKCYKKRNDDKNSEKYNRLFQSYSHINNAKNAIESQDYDKALEEYKAALAINSNDYEIIDALIELSFAQKQLDEAVDYAVLGLKIAKSNNDTESAAKYLYHIGTRYDISNYNIKAAEFYELATNTATEINNKLKYCQKLALFLSSNGNNLKGLEFLKKCQEYIKEGATDIYDIQSDIIKLEEIIDKDSDLNKSIEHYNLGGKYFNEMNFEEAANEMRIALSYIPQDLDAMDVLNRCLFKLKKYDDCIEVAHEGYLICCRDRDFRFYDMFCYNLGNCYYNMKDNETALKYYQQALNTKPYDIDYLYFVAACHRNLGNFEKALELFQIANKIAPDDKSIAEQIAICKANSKST